MSGATSGTSAAARTLLGAGGVALVLCMVAVWLGGRGEVGGAVGAAPADPPAVHGELSRAHVSRTVPRAAARRSPAPVKRHTLRPPRDKAVAARSVRAYLQKVTAVLSSPREADRAAVARIGTRVFADELRATAAYNRADGVRVVGKPTVSALKVLHLDTGARPPRAVAEACIDSTAVRLVDRRGRTVPQPPRGRTHETFSLVWSGGRWLIDSQGFTDDPNC